MAYRPFRHLGLKLLSITIATLLWLVVSDEQVVERGLRVPLEYQNLPERLELVDDPPAAVDVRVRGSSGALGRLAPGDLVAVLDLRNTRQGRRLFHLTAEHVRAPFGVDVVQVSPATLSLSFERSASRVVPVVPAVEGDPAPGFVVGQVKSEPATVEVVGPEGRLRQLTEAMTEPISVSGASKPLVEVVTVGVADPELRLKTPGRATVAIGIVPAPVERMIEKVPVHVRNLGPHLSARAVPAAIAIGARGSPDKLSTLQNDAVYAFVDLEGLGAGRYSLPVRVEPAQDVAIARIDPAVVQIWIR